MSNSSKPHYRYIYLNDLKHLWIDISHMVNENYFKCLGHRDSLIIGACSIIPLSELKKQYDADRYIVYQLEPLHENHWHPMSKILSNIEGADEVWDYDLDNIETLRSHGINAKFKPFLYTEQLNSIPKLKDDELDIDLLFYGSLFKERLDIIHRIYCKVGSYYNVVVVWNMNNVQLDELISRTKVIVDLQTKFSHNIQKQVRIYHALSNDKCVVSEKSKRNYFGDLIIESERDNLPDTLLDILNRRLWKQKVKMISGKFKEYSQKISRGIS
tara:strand:+ start:53 stop:865 length:813 start_codon:yes stop_codon:yes gene_type:complete